MSGSLSRNAVIDKMDKKLSKMSSGVRRKYLMYLLLRYKVDHSLTSRNTGRIKYKSLSKCEEDTKEREKRGGMYGEKYIWKPVGREKEFREIIENKRMPWVPRSGEGSEERKALYEVFKYIFRNEREGVFVSVRDNRITHWVPFFKAKYVNEKIKLIKFDKVPEKRRPKKEVDWLTESCYIVENYRRTERGMAEYRDMIMEACREGVEDVDFFINMKRSPIIPKGKMENRFGIFVLSGVGMKEYEDIPIPSPEEWASVTKTRYTLGCKYFDSDSLVKEWSKKKSEVIYRDTVSGCYSREPLLSFMMSRAELVNFLRKYEGVDSGLQGGINTMLRTRNINKWEKEAYLWPDKIHASEKAVKDMTEIEYDPQMFEKNKWLLKRSGSKEEQEEVMEKVAYGGNRWWPWDQGYRMTIPTYVPPSGKLAGGPMYDKVVYAYYNLEGARSSLGMKKTMYENRGWDSPRSDSSGYKPAKSRTPSKSSIGSVQKEGFRRFNVPEGVVRKSEVELWEGIVEDMEKKFEEVLKRGNAEKYYIIGRGGIKNSRIISKYKKLPARNPEGLVGKDGLSGLRKYWKKNKVGGKEERESLMLKIKAGSLLSEYKTFEEQSKSKFLVVYNDVPSIFDYYLKASMGSVMLLFVNRGEDSPKHWLLDELKGGEHYIKVNRSNFEEVYNWCMKYKDSRKVKEISKNLLNFMNKKHTKKEMISRIRDISTISNYYIYRINK